MHLLPVAIKIFCASHIYVYITFCKALFTVGDISLPSLIIWAGFGGKGPGPGLKTKYYYQLPSFLESYLANRYSGDSGLSGDGVWFIFSLKRGLQRHCKSYPPYLTN